MPIVMVESDAYGEPASHSASKLWFSVFNGKYCVATLCPMELTGLLRGLVFWTSVCFILEHSHHVLASNSSSSSSSSTGTGDCAPVTWEQTPPSGTATVPAASPRREFARHAKIGPVEAGEVNCRYIGKIRDEAGAAACRKLCKEYNITLRKFLTLNPGLKNDCGNVESYSEYCVAGFIEPLRAHDGRCGPPHNGATCIGVKHGQCCNSETWTCGSSEEDCAPGICYEGFCHGHKIFTTDGTCGPTEFDTLRYCTGKWGDCCSIDGSWGTGQGFCSAGKCSHGNCDSFRDTRWQRYSDVMSRWCYEKDISAGLCWVMPDWR